MACERVAHYLALIQDLSKMHIGVGAWLDSISLVPIGKVDTHTVYIHYTELYLVFLLPVSFKISSKLIFSKWNLFLNFKNVARVLVKIPMYNYNAIQTHKFTIKYKKNRCPIAHFTNASIMTGARSRFACSQIYETKLLSIMVEMYNLCIYKCAWCIALLIIHCET